MQEDWDQFTPFMQAALDLMPALHDAGIQHFMNGPESFTSDTRPLVGETPDIDGLFVAAGMNSVGVMSSAGIGKVLADWMADGYPPMDLWEIDIARADPKTATPDHMADRMREAVADLFSLHWPHKQPKAGRDLRRSCLHDRWLAKGAVFGLTAGWERGLWYARDDSERNLPYSVGAQAWQSIVEREAATMESGTVLLDLSPFSKFDINGPAALPFLQHIACANLDVKTGRAVYTPLLNTQGGIEADVTITRLAAHQFRMTSGAATRWRDLAYLRRNAEAFAVNIDDVTETEAVIGVMGAGSRQSLESIASGNWNGFPFATCRTVEIAGVTINATRLSFVGELGWELGIPVAAAPVVFDRLIEAGAKPMGHYALEACRIEKGFRHWGHDLGPALTPLEAGLGFTIDWDKDFIGKNVLLEQKQMGIQQRSVLLSIEGNPLALHDEPVWEGDVIVGLTTSGTKAARTELTLAFALIETAPDETLAATCTRHFEVEIAGQRYPAQGLIRPPFDPKGERMRA